RDLPDVADDDPEWLTGRVIVDCPEFHRCCVGYRAVNAAARVAYARAPAWSSSSSMNSSTRWARPGSPGPKPTVGIPSAAVPLPLVQNSQCVRSAPSASITAVARSGGVNHASAKFGASTSAPEYESNRSTP